jgi:hypothetical protein
MRSELREAMGASFNERRSAMTGANWASEELTRGAYLLSANLFEGHH